MPTGIIMGAMEHREYSSRTIGIGAGDVVVLYTDGVTESINNHVEMFGEERLKTIIRENARLSSRDILTKILTSVETFSSGEPQFDDITLMVIKGI